MKEAAARLNRILEKIGPHVGHDFVRTGLDWNCARCRVIDGYLIGWKWP